MKRVLGGVRAFIFVLALSFQAAFTAVLTSQQHAVAIATQGTGYTDITTITNSPARQARFFNHVVEQHFGLYSNSYTTYQPVGSENKELRSEFILANGAAISAVIGGGVIGVVARRQDVEIRALHNYLFEVLIYKRLPIDSQIGLTEMTTIVSTEYTEAFLSGGDIQQTKDQRTHQLQTAIDTLNASAVWGNLNAVYNQQGHGPFFDNITTLRGLITAAATGGATPLTTRPTPADKVTVLTNIRDRIKNLIESFTDIIRAINDISYSESLLSSKAPQHIKEKMQRMINSINKPAIWDKLETISAALPGASIAIPAAGVRPAVTYTALNTNITVLRGLITAAATGGATPLTTIPNPAAKVAVIIRIREQIGNLISLQRLNDAIAIDAHVIAQEIFEYAMGLPSKQPQVAGDSIDIFCPIQPPFPAGISRMVSQAPWYDAGTRTMITQAARPDAREIMVGFLRYVANGVCTDGTGYHQGDIDYSTMYSK